MIPKSMTYCSSYCYNIDNPFLQPAIEKSIPELKKQIKKAVEEYIEKEKIKQTDLVKDFNFPPVSPTLKLNRKKKDL